MESINSNLHKARILDNDEFYTRMIDIQNELDCHKESFNNKVVYCNCDSHKQSNFVKYFISNFKELNLKKLISTSFSPNKQSVLFTYDGNSEIETDMNGNGDFRSKECIDLLEQSDIVVTNPPFSLFNDFIKLMINKRKQFIVIGPKNAISYKEIFPYIRDNKLWVGYTPISKNLYFDIPEDMKLGYEPTNSHYTVIDGDIKGRAASMWYTNMPVSRRNKPLDLVCTYSKELYPTYDNYDAIEVGKVKEIPNDYYGVIGVPITFIDKYCPSQFEILDMSPHFFTLIEKGLEKPKQLSLKEQGLKDPFARILIKRK